MKANDSFFFSECKDHVLVDIQSFSSTMNFRFTSERIVDKGLLLTITTKKEKGGFDLNYELSQDNQLLAQDGGQNIPPKDLFYVISDIVNDAFSCEVRLTA